MSATFSHEQENNLLRIRIVLCTVLAFTVMFPAMFQPALDRLWATLLAFPLYNVSLQVL